MKKEGVPQPWIFEGAGGGTGGDTGGVGATIVADNLVKSTTESRRVYQLLDAPAGCGVGN